MKDYIENGDVINITLDDGRIVKVMTKFINNMMVNLEIDKEEALLTWLEDESYLINDEQEELNNEAKANKVKVKAESKPKAKTQRERVVKENPEKEAVIKLLADTLDNIEIYSDIVIENKSKLITFRLGDNEYKLDLICKRKPKGDK
jgi:phosphatidate phosphatase APP1